MRRQDVIGLTATAVVVALGFAGTTLAVWRFIAPK